MWDIRRFARIDECPPHPVVIQFQLRDAREGERTWWLVVEDGVADLCRDDPGRELTLVVEAALASGEVQVHGGQRYAERLWRWLGTSPFAPSRRRA
jgi:hypothetical protein